MDVGVIMSITVSEYEKELELIKSDLVYFVEVITDTELHLYQKLVLRNLVENYAKKLIENKRR
jgi:hypothetical protein